MKHNGQPAGNKILPALFLSGAMESGGMGYSWRIVSNVL